VPPLTPPTQKIPIPLKKGSLIEDRDIAKYWYYLAHMLKYAVSHKSMNRGKFTH
jgi:hypothetical protein